MNTRVIRYGSDEYLDSLHLRSSILRAPLGKELSDEDVAGEDQQIHLGFFQNQQLMGCIVAKSIRAGQDIKLRQMAIAAEVQGKGLGRRLLRDAESLLRDQGFREIELHARKTAIPFYEKQGYMAVGDIFLEQGIEHIRMQKTL